MVKVIHKCYLLPCFLMATTIISALILTRPRAFAGNPLNEDVNVTVPVSCNLTGANTEHVAAIHSGDSSSDIGLSTIKAYCNDAEGFAIYAIGYTDDTDGKTVLANPTLGSTFDIPTGTLTSGNNSQWAMKLEASSDSATYPITIKNDFNAYHAVPDEYTLVAKRTAHTDVGANAIGSTLTSTYQIYISPAQPNGTYRGKVKYVLVHPNYVDSTALADAVTVIFDGNGFTFPDGSTTNMVKYANVCKPNYLYVGNTYREVMSSNITTGGDATGPYTNDEYVLENITFDDADAIKVVIDYGFTGDTMGVMFVNANWDGDGDNWGDDWDEVVLYEEENTSGTESFIMEGNAITVYAKSWDPPISDYDYGFYAKIYPVYYTEHPDTTVTESPSEDCSVMPILGTYQEPDSWQYKQWTATINGREEDFQETTECNDFGCYEYTPEENLSRYIRHNFDSLTGTTITLYAYSPVTFDMVYAAAGKTKIDGYYQIQDLDASMCSEVTKGETTTVIDVRDHNTYRIGRFKDGNCWLRDNLILDPTDPNIAANLSDSNTNASSEAIHNYLNGGNTNNHVGWSDTAVVNSSNWSSGTYTSPLIYVASENNSSKVFYNYCAASVGTYCYNPNDQTPGVNYRENLCPSGWRMPLASEYNFLVTNYRNRFISDFAPTLGYFNISSITNSDGIFWSSSVRSWGSTAINGDYHLTSIYRYRRGAYAFTFGEGDHMFRRNQGGYVRCLVNIPSNEQ